MKVKINRYGIYFFVIEGEAEMNGERGHKRDAMEISNSENLK